MKERLPKGLPERLQLVLKFVGNCKLQFPYLLKMLCELSHTEGVEEQFPEVRENYLYEKLLNHLDKRELCGFRSTK